MDIAKYKDKLWQVKEILVTVLGIGLLAQAIVYMCDGSNEVYQTLQNIWYAKAFLMLTAFFCVIQRIRLFNWQSLVVSLLYLPIGYSYRTRYIESPDLFNRDRVVVWIAWFLLMLAVDMIVYKRYTDLCQFRKSALIIFVLLTLAQIFYRNGRNHPLMLVVAFMFYLIPMDRRKWRSVINQFCYGWLVAFIVILCRSVVNNPDVSLENGRWYGDFLNIGDFGQFLGCVFVVVVYKLYQVKKEKGWDNIEFILWLPVGVALIWAMLRVNTVTMWLGTLLVALCGFIVIRKDVSAKKLLQRTLLALTVIGALATAGLWGMKLLATPDIEYWDKLRTSNNLFAQAATALVNRAYYTFGNAEATWDGGVFEAGTIMNALDLFSSGRLSIISYFAEQFSFIGNPSYGIQVGGYFAYNAHNTYTQMLFEYGYIGGGLFIAWVFAGMWGAVKAYIRRQEAEKVLPVWWVAMLVGLMMGESIWFYYPALVMTLLMLYPVMVQVPEEDKASKV